MKRIIALSLLCAFPAAARDVIAPAPVARVAAVADYGRLVPDDTTAAAANSTSLQAAIDALQSANVGKPTASTVAIPAGDYFLSRPIALDGNGVGLRGEGKGVSRLMMLGGHDVLSVGIGRAPNVGKGPVALTPSHFVDLHTGGQGGAAYLNGVTSAPGQKWGLRTLGDCHLAQQGGAFDSGLLDWYAATPALTIDFAVDLTHARESRGWSDGVSLMGLTEAGNPSPWEMQLSHGQFMVTFRTAEPGIDKGTNRRFLFYPIPDGKGLTRVTVQVDLATASVAAWVDNVRVPVVDQLGKDFKAGSAFKFVANQHCPFGLGSNSVRANQVADIYGAAADLTWCGLKVSGAALYADGPAGSAQARRDGKPILDGYRYFTYVRGETIGLLPLTDGPDRACGDRVITVMGNGGTATTAYFLDDAAHGSNWASTHPGTIRDLSLVGGSVYYGRAVATGFGLGLDVRDVEALGGHQGVGSLNFGSNYPVTIRDTTLQGRDAAFYSYYGGNVRLEGISIPKGARCPIRLNLVTGCTMRDMFSGNWGVPDFVIKATRSAFTISDSNFDNESGGGAQIAAIYASPNPEIGSRIKVERVGFGGYAKDAPLVYLDDAAGGTPAPNSFTLSDCGDLFRGDRKHRVVQAGKRWDVNVDLPK